MTATAAAPAVRIASATTRAMSDPLRPEPEPVLVCEAATCCGWLRCAGDCFLRTAAVAAAWRPELLESFVDGAPYWDDEAILSSVDASLPPLRATRCCTDCETFAAGEVGCPCVTCPPDAVGRT